MIKKIWGKPMKLMHILMGIVIIRLLTDYIYGNIIAKYFTYNGFVDNTSIFSVLLSWCILFISFPFFSIYVKHSKSRPSAIVIQILYFLSFLPFTTCIGFALFEWKYTIYGVMFWIVMFSMEIINIGTQNKTFPELMINFKSINKILLIIIATVSCFVTIYLSYKYTGLRLHFNLLTVYDLREEAEGYDLSRAMAYLYAWTRAINPFMLSYCYLRKERFYAFIFLGCSLLNFGFDGSKTALFLPIFFGGVAILYKYYNSIDVTKMFVSIFFIIGIIGILEFVLNQTYYLSSYFVRRLMMVENLNSYYYFDFFTKNIPDFFRMSFLRLLGFETPYPSLAKIIGNTYYGTETNANCGLIADAVTNFGMFGIIGYPILFFIIMKIYDKLAKNLSSALIVCVSLYISIQLINTYMMTSLLTHGILIIYILIYCVSKEKENDHLENKGIQYKCLKKY